MKRRFVTNLIFLLSLNVFIKSFWILGVDRGVQNALPAQDYGIYFALLNLTFLFNIILDFGITNYNNRIIAQHPQLIGKYFSRIVPIKFSLAVLFTVVVFTFALIAGYSAFELKLLGWLCFAQFLSSLTLYLRSNISGLLMFKTDSVLSVMDRFLMVVFCSLLLWSGILKTQFRIEFFVYAQVIAYLITAIIALLICLKHTGFIRLRWNKAFVLKVIKDCYPYALLVLLMAFYNRADSVMIERMLGDKGADYASVYASAFRLVDAANMIAYLFAVILLPLFARMIKQHKDVTPIIKISFHLLLVTSVTFALISLFYGDDLMNALYNKHIEASGEVYKVLAFCFVPISMTYIFGTLLTANGSLKKLNLVASLGMVLNVGINLILIPRYEALGAAYSSLIAQTVTAALQAAIAIKIFGIPIKKSYISNLLLFLVIISTNTYLLKNGAINWIVNVIIAVFVILFTSLLFKIFNLKDFIRLIKSSNEE